MKVLLISLAFVGTSALACPYDDVKDAKAPAHDKAAVAQVKAPTPTPTAAAPKSVTATKKAETKVADKSTADARKASSL